MKQPEPRPTATQLKDADIVLTTYEALRADVYHDGGTPRTLRNRKRYRVEVSPLLRLRWWRVCLDEAQMVEAATAKVGCFPRGALRPRCFETLLLFCLVFALPGSAGIRREW
eukprot:3102552-Rhodomonas_salina.1